MSFAPKQFIRSVDFLSTENSINTSTGSVNIYGGMSVSKDSYLNNVIVAGNSTIANLTISGNLITSTGNTLISSQWTSIDSNTDIYFGTSANVFVGIGTTTPNFNLDISGGSRITQGLTVGSLNVNAGASITNLLNTTICTGTIIITNGITTGTINVTGTSTFQNTTVTNITSTNIIGTTVSTGNIYGTLGTISNLVATTSLSTGTLVGTTVSVGNIYGTLGTISNLVATTSFSTGTLVGTTVSTGNIYGTLGTISNFVATSITASNLRVSGNVNVTNITATTLNATGVTTSSLLASNSILTNVSVTNMNSSTNTIGTLNATGITTASLLVTNAVATNLSSGIAIFTTGLTTATLLATTSISTGLLNSTNTTITNAVATNLSSGIAIFTTGLTTATLLATTSISTGLLNSTNTTITNAVATNLSSGIAIFTTGLTSANIFVTGPGNLNGNSNTLGSIITTGGNIGIGSVTPSYKLDVNGIIRNNTDIIMSSASRATLYNDSGALQIRSGSTNMLHLNQDNSGNMSLAMGGGSVGIGTTSPGYKLHVVGDIYASGDITAFSDIRLKENIVQLIGCLDKIDNMRGVSFNRIDTGTKHIGLIAQEVESQFPELVATDQNTGLKSVNYGNVVAVLLECIRELKGEFNEFKARK
jgi:hypothetical protein